MYLLLFEFNECLCRPITISTNSFTEAKKKAIDLLILDKTKLEGLNAVFFTEIPKPMVSVDKQNILKEIEERA